MAGNALSKRVSDIEKLREAWMPSNSPFCPGYVQLANAVVDIDADAAPEPQVSALRRANAGKIIPVLAFADEQVITAIINGTLPTKYEKYLAKKVWKYNSFSKGAHPQRIVCPAIYLNYIVKKQNNAGIEQEDRKEMIRVIRSLLKEGDLTEEDKKLRTKATQFYKGRVGQRKGGRGDFVEDLRRFSEEAGKKKRITGNEGGVRRMDQFLRAQEDFVLESSPSALVEVGWVGPGQNNLVDRLENHYKLSRTSNLPMRLARVALETIRPGIYEYQQFVVTYAVSAIEGSIAECLFHVLAGSYVSRGGLNTWTAGINNNSNSKDNTVWTQQMDIAFSRGVFTKAQDRLRNYQEKLKNYLDESRKAQKIQEDLEEVQQE